MHHVPQPKDQARILTAALDALGLELPYQQALEVTAKMMGHKNWAAHSAAFETEQGLAKPVQPTPATPALLGPAGGDIYEALVTVDQTMSARIRVQAGSPEQARQLLQEAAAAQFPTGFEVDEGNYRGISDYYLGDPDALENLSTPKLDVQNDNYWAKATWQDALHRYEVELSRDEPDCSDEEREATVTLVLRLHREGSELVRTVELDVFGDLRTYLEEGLEELEFEERFSEMRRHWLKSKSKSRRK